MLHIRMMKGDGSEEWVGRISEQSQGTRSAQDSITTRVINTHT